MVSRKMVSRGWDSCRKVARSVAAKREVKLGRFYFLFVLKFRKNGKGIDAPIIVHRLYGLYEVEALGF